MLLIKRYPNRKMYNSRAKSYITLEEVARLLRLGEDIQVQDYATGEDLTSLILSQIILEQEKKKTGFFPQSILSNLVRFRDDGNLLSHIFSSIGFTKLFAEEIKRRIDILLHDGEILPEEAHRMKELLIGDLPKIGKSYSIPSTEEIILAINAKGIPSREQILSLREQIDNLANEIEDICQKKDNKRNI